MRFKIEGIVAELQNASRSLTMDSIEKIREAMVTIARDTEAQSQLQRDTHDLPQGLELYREEKSGFVFLAYSEGRGTYRIPHDHGDAWVIYAVVSGEMEMGNYFKAGSLEGRPQLILKKRELLRSGDTRVYYPGEIHDTRCLSHDAVILRLTSQDLRQEEQAGRMKRYQV